MLGTAQSGLSDVRFPEWISDTRLIHRANKLAADILEQDPTLSGPEHTGLRNLTCNLPSTATRPIG